MSRNGESPDEAHDVRVVRNPRGWEYVYKPQYVQGLTSRQPAIPFHGPQSERRVISPEGTVFAPSDDGFAEAIENFRSGFASNGNLPSGKTQNPPATQCPEAFPVHAVPQESSPPQEMQL